MSRMIAKKKPKKDYVVTAHDLTKVERRWQDELAKMKVSATQDSTKIVQALIYLSLLHTHPSWTWQAIAKVQEEADRIADLIADPDADYGWDDVYAELEAKGVGIEGVNGDV